MSKRFMILEQGEKPNIPFGFSFMKRKISDGWSVYFMYKSKRLYDAEYVDVDTLELKSGKCAKTKAVNIRNPLHKKILPRIYFVEFENSVQTY